ncbi:MAG: hypothetical protein JXB47_01980 [Anaerolineae bacterium]|nr:hypothetical protein [Anaerolineae bacterium]
MQALEKIGGWFKADIPAFILAAVFVLPALAMLIPYRYDSFALHALIQGLAFAMQGIVMWTLMPYAAQPALYVASLCGFWLIAGLVIRRLWARGLGERAIVFLVLLINTTFFGVSGAAAFVGAASNAPIICEQLISEETGVRLESRLRLYNSHNFFLATQDGGATWTQFRYAYDRGVLPKCEHIKWLDDSFFWVWDQQILMLTSDGGKTWQIASVGETWNEWSWDYLNWTIGDVTFQDTQHGEMLLRFSSLEYNDNITLYTDDGGLTWSSENPRRPDADA